MQIAVFISPHGFGHASRCAAVMAALQQRIDGVTFHIFTNVPQWFFTQSLSAGFRYHALHTDVGMIQNNPMFADLDATVAALDRMLPFDNTLIRQIARQIKALECRLVICDIAPIGIAVAREAGVQSVLIENFTWDWIYEIYAERAPRLKTHINYLNRMFLSADILIQTEPLCRRGSADLVCAPISRSFRIPPNELRKKLSIADSSKLVVLTMGGILDEFGFRDHLRNLKHLHFVIPGGGPVMQSEKNIINLPHNSNFFHPDMINAADAVIGKAGYSTLAEVYYAGVPFGYVARPDFRETNYLTQYVKTHMSGIPIHHDHFYSGAWTEQLDQLLALTKKPVNHPNGAETVADYLCTHASLGHPQGAFHQGPY